MPNNPKIDTVGIITGLEIPTPSILESKAPIVKPSIRVKSLDFDGCMFTPEYIGFYLKNDYHFESDIPLFEENTDPLFTTNKLFFDEVKKECSEGAHQKLILLCGSLRQGEVSDVYSRVSFLQGNKLKSESAFSALIKIKDKLSKEVETKCVLDKFLMSDLCSEEKHGTNFDQTISNRQLINKTGHELHDKAINDKTKVTLLYTQMHKIASEHPDDTILFDFYDDQNYILNSLKYTFAVHPDLIPKNVTLNLKQYDGKCLSNIKSIQGEGRIDFNYADNIKLLLQHALGIEHQINLKDYFDQYDVDMLMYKGHDKYPDFLKARQLKKDLEPADTSTPTPLEVITPTPSL